MIIQLLKLIKKRLFPDRRAEVGEASIPKILKGAPFRIVDVGAACGLQPQWKILERASEVFFIEPNPDSIRELKTMYSGLPRVHYLQEAVSDQDGDKILYVTKESTGASLLRLNEEWIREYGDPGYLFPLREVKIKTKTLQRVLDEAGCPSVDMIKIDVQGAELEVLSGLDPKRLQGIVGAELEVGLPGGYLGQASFGKVLDFMAKYDLELFDMHAARIYRPKNGQSDFYQNKVFGVYSNSPSISARLVEIDSVFFKSSKTVLESGDPQLLRRLIVAYCTYNFFSEAYAAVEKAEETKLVSSEDSAELRAAILGWHKSLFGSFFSRPGAILSALRKLHYRLSHPTAPRWSQYIKYQYPHG